MVTSTLSMLDDEVMIYRLKMIWNAKLPNLVF